MEYDPTTTEVSITWTPDTSRAEMGRILGCPTYAERTPAVDASWARFLALLRSSASSLVTTDSFSLEPNSRADRLIKEWAFVNNPSEEVRVQYAHEYALDLAQHTDGLADDLCGEPTMGIAFDASSLMRAPRIVALLDGPADLAESLDVDLDRAELSLCLSRSAQELGAFAERVYNTHCELVGQQSIDALLRRDLEGPERHKLFDFCLVQQTPDALIQPEAGYTLFDSVVLAASVVRWCRFWGNNGIGSRAHVPPGMFPPVNE